MVTTQDAIANPFLTLTDGERSLIAKGLVEYEAETHNFQILMPAAGKYVQVMDTMKKCPDFYKSIAQQWRRYGRLSDKQVMAVMHGVARCPLIKDMLVDSDPEPEFKVEYPVATVKPIFQEVPAGTYTLVDSEGHITIRVKEWTPQGETVAKKIVAVLVGPDNTHNYQAFAEVKNDEIRPWSRFRTGYDRWKDAAAALFTGDFKEFGYQYALASNNCWRCGATLTVPASISRGLGPVCAEMAGYGN